MYVGDIQLMDFISWVQNGISWEHQGQPYRGVEMEMPLYTRPKTKEASRTFYDWVKVTLIDSGKKKIYPLRERAFKDYEESTTAKIPIAIAASTHKWVRMST